MAENTEPPFGETTVTSNSREKKPRKSPGRRSHPAPQRTKQLKEATLAPTRRLDSSSILPTLDTGDTQGLWACWVPSDTWIPCSTFSLYATHLLLPSLFDLNSYCELSSLFLPAGSIPFIVRTILLLLSTTKELLRSTYLRKASHQLSLSSLLPRPTPFSSKLDTFGFLVAHGGDLEIPFVV